MQHEDGKKGNRPVFAYESGNSFGEGLAMTEHIDRKYKFLRSGRCHNGSVLRCTIGVRRDY